VNPSTTPNDDRHFDSADTLADALAADLAAALRSAIDARGQALIAVSGGSSPKPLFARLAVTDLDWSSVVVAQVDERWLPTDHADSNARMIREHLLRDRAAAARFLPMKNAAATPEAGQAECEAQLRALPLPFDLIVLGMGEDGHTASLFPQAAALAVALDPDGPLCAAVHPPNAPHARMSLTLAGLLASRRLVLPLSGVSKLRVLAGARQEGPVESMPVRAVLRQTHVPLEVWCSP
jgi:6-phosphogluconolactonase